MPLSSSTSATSNSSSRDGLTPHQMKEVLEKGARILGIDPGTKRIGLAISDVSCMLASPFKLIEAGKMKRIVSDIKEVCKHEEIGGLVIGLPLELDGNYGSSAQRAKDWGLSLAEMLELPVGFQDERLSSNAVNRFLIKEADMTRKRREDVVDKMAASYFLQVWLEKMRLRD